jgi:hypothetical protein
LTAFQPPPPHLHRLLNLPLIPGMGLLLMARPSLGLGDGHPCLLVSLVQHADARVLGQVIVALKRDERSAVPGLMAGRDLTGRVVMLDALSASQLGAGGLGSGPDEGWRITLRLLLGFCPAHHGDPLTAK